MEEQVIITKYLKRFTVSFQLLSEVTIIHSKYMAMLFNT